MSKKHILITGATGLLGSYILKNCIEDDQSIIYLIVKRKDIDSITRIKILLKDFLGIAITDGFLSSRISVFEGNLEDKFLGVGIENYQFLQDNVNYIFHAAAITNLRLPLDILRNANVLTTKNIVKFARNCSSLKNFNYISTFFICGKHCGVFSEKDFDLKQSFNNFYEQSKFEAEEIVRKNLSNGFNTVIFRPTGIMGALEDGKIKNFSNLYIPLYFFSKAIFEEIPLLSKSYQNIVPVDWAAKVIYQLGIILRGSQTLHIAHPKNILVQRFFELASQFFGYKNPRFLSIKEFDSRNLSTAQKIIFNSMNQYLSLNAEIGLRSTLQNIDSLKLPYPLLNDVYFFRLFEYCSVKRFIGRNVGKNVLN
jgi:thioester reductase-like protein